jgi:hypothetical protein
MSVILALRRWRQEYHEYKANLGYIVNPFLKTNKLKKKKVCQLTNSMRCLK